MGLHRRILTAIIEDMPERIHKEYVPFMEGCLDGTKRFTRANWDSVQALLDKRISEGMLEEFLVRSLFQVIDDTLAHKADPEEHARGVERGKRLVEMEREKHGDRVVEDAKTNKNNMLYGTVRWLEDPDARLAEEVALYDEWNEHPLVKLLKAIKPFGGYWTELYPDLPAAKEVAKWLDDRESARKQA